MTFCHKNRHAPFAMELKVPVNIKMTNLLQICRVCVMETSMDKLVDVVEARDYKLSNDIYDFFKIRVSYRSYRLTVARFVLARASRVARVFLV